LYECEELIDVMIYEKELCPLRLILCTSFGQGFLRGIDD